ncbi:DUF484 family protein [Vibrio sp. V27_P1S3P104]|uniref:DUF484 family protein n=1 Tax=unclassified Vibrio TaxID=2614977 RepID=UPI0013724426|nr:MULTISPECIES: DUF484 family protein [unclassified Vibrio]NAW68948.1 DUF484 family protein [Vibrio sp. V28_P6S34P95]NAX03858.1 DUF484 family protein [Vibrio sp. V30_P3S12P165]NAX35015.1 DUF484 family protein [Vibrio sp. V29_P1S30P107]NAX38888.1 DUF484 family protein [Vibrio sp. V27_P1S3P104]NAX39841.1 DUF484 family protein [Vibrio sp. V26_P1S5P106]
MLQQQADALTAEVVAEYLRDHPDFFLHYPQLVESFSLPRSDAGTISLVHIQMARQRQRIEELEEEITTLMSLAANNDRTFHEFMALQETLLQCRSLRQVFQAIEDTAKRLGLTAYVRLIGSPMNEYAITQEQWQRFATNHFNGKSAYLGRLRQADRHQLFGEQSLTPEMGSYVVLALGSSQSQGVLAFASTDGGHFQPCMDTLFLRHLALVLTHLIDLLPWEYSEHERIHSPSA